MDYLIDLLHDLHRAYRRLRGAPTIVKHGAWSTEGNPHFGRCRWCGHTTLMGICQHCGAHTDCAWCGKVHLPDGSWAAVAHLDDSPIISHGICPACKKAQLQQCKCAATNRPRHSNINYQPVGV